MSLLMILQLLIVLGALWVGSRYGSLALGAISGIGLAILVFGFSLKPGTPPTDVIYIIIAAVTCAGIMQASGGMDWLIQIAERLLRKHPDRITFLALRCGFYCLSGRYHLFSYRRCRSGLREHFECKRFRHHDSWCTDDFHPRLCLRIDGCRCRFLSSWLRP